MAELSRFDDVVAAGEGDPLVVWAAQDLGPGVRAWAAGGALAVASPGLSNRDRLVVRGPQDALVPLVARVLGVLGPAYRPLGDPAAVAALVARLPLEKVGEFAWMDAEGAPPRPAGARAAWLGDGARAEVASLLDAAFPASLARPGVAGVRRWAGVRHRGTLASIAAEAWSCRDVAFLSGVATDPELRGRGLGRSVCEFAVRALLAEHARVGLFVDRDNVAAISLYESMGMRLRPVAAARQPPGSAPAPPDPPGRGVAPNGRTRRSG